MSLNMWNRIYTPVWRTEFSEPQAVVEPKAPRMQNESDPAPYNRRAGFSTRGRRIGVGCTWVSPQWSA